jgi:hypothetical protein
MTHPAGWYADPFGRFQQRYWDGAAWTEHVSTNGAQAVDPLGSTVVIPIATPASAYVAPEANALATAPAAGGGGGATARGFLDVLGPDARERPAPRLSMALAGSGGAVAAAGIAIAIVGTDGSRGKAAVAGAVIVAIALAVRLMLARHLEPAAAGVGAGVVGLAVLGGAIVGDDLDTGWALFVVGVLFIAAWVLPGFRGRSIMLGIGTLLWVAALAAVTSSSGSDEGVLGEVPYGGFVGDQEVVFLLAAAVLLGLVWWLDRAGYRGVGTSLVVAALVSAFVGVAQATSNLDDAGSAILITIVGLIVCVVGSHGGRRATTWWGALLATIGVVGFFAATMTPDSTSSMATMLLISGALLIVGPVAVRAIRKGQQSKSGPIAPGGASTTLPPPTA